MRLITFNIASVDGRIAVSRSTPSGLDPRWQPLGRFEPVDILARHGARVFLEGSNSFTVRDAPAAAFDDHAGASVPPGDFVPESLRAHRGRSSGTASSRTSSRNEEARGEPALLSFWQRRNRQTDVQRK